MSLVKESLSDQIYQILKKEILTNKINFGSKLVNRQLQERFGVSSSPIRDAINHLYQDGLISSIDNTGANVVDFDYDLFLEVNEVLLYIVNTGIKLSYEKSDINEICKNLEKYIYLQQKHINTDEFFDYDYKFHKTFIDFSSNSRLKKLFKEYNVLYEMLVRNYFHLESSDMQKSSIKMHIKIKDVFSKGDYILASELTEEHYKSAEKIFRYFKEKNNNVERKLASGSN